MSEGTIERDLRTLRDSVDSLLHEHDDLKDRVGELAGRLDEAVDASDALREAARDALTKAQVAPNDTARVTLCMAALREIAGT